MYTLTYINTSMLRMYLGVKFYKKMINGNNGKALLLYVI